MMLLPAISEKARPFLLFAICMVAGGISSLAMAPTNFWPALFLGLSVLYVALVQSSSAKAAFFYGWGFAFCYFLFSLSWIGNALLVDGNPYAWAWPLAVCGLPFILAPFSAIACYCAKKFFNLKTAAGFFGLAALLAGLEWLRGYVFTGFPWNLYGYTWLETLALVQVVSFSNVYFLTWFTIIWGAAAGFLAIKAPVKQKGIVAGIAMLSLLISFAYGHTRLQSYEAQYHENTQIRMVQPNIAQADKWDKDKMTEHFFTHLRLSYPEEQTEKTTYIIWPETALSYWYLRDENSLNLIKQMLSSYEGDAYLFSGLLRRDQDGTYYNSLIKMNKNGEIQDVYDKQHLVPFGEYIPYQKWIPLHPVVEFTGFKAGETKRVTEASAGLKYMALICYEVIFPSLIKDKNEQPDFIINVTNDAWYGDSAGPRQHLAKAIFRAAETGTPLVRIANTGISSLINPVGETLVRTDIFKESAKTHLIPKKNMDIKKTYALETIAFWLLIMLNLLVCGCFQRKSYFTSN